MKTGAWGNGSAVSRSTAWRFGVASAVRKKDVEDASAARAPHPARERW